MSYTKGLYSKANLPLCHAIRQSVNVDTKEQLPELILVLYDEIHVKWLCEPPVMIGASRAQSY